MKLVASRKKLYTGDIKLLFNHDVDVKVYEHTFNTHTIIESGTLNDLKATLPNLDFLQLIAASDFQHTINPTTLMRLKLAADYPTEQSFYSAEGLIITHTFRDNLLYLFSFGEIEPGKYMFWSEGVWDIAPLEKQTTPEHPKEPLHQFHSNMGETGTPNYTLPGVDPRTNRAPIKDLQGLQAVFIANGWKQFYIDGFEFPSPTDVDMLGFRDGNWQVCYIERGKWGEPVFITSDRDEAIAYYYNHIKKIQHVGAIPPSPQTEPDVAATSSAFVNDGYFPEIRLHNTTLFKKQFRQLLKFTGVCAITGAALDFFDLAGSQLFFFFTGVLGFWLIIFRFKQDLSQPAFSVAEEGVFINQQFLRNAFVPWENIDMATLRGYADTPSIVLTFANIKTLLKDQFFVFKSLAKAQLKMTPTMVISGVETEGDLTRTFAIMKQYLPAEKITEALPHHDEKKRAPARKEAAYVRLDDNRTKAYYREILEQALQQAEEDYRRSPDLALNASFFNQLTDIKKTVVEQGVIYTEAEADKLYPLGIMAIRNFDGYPDDWDYPKKLVDISAGISQYHLMPEKNV